MDNTAAITNFSFDFTGSTPSVPTLEANRDLMRQIDEANNMLRLFKKMAVQEKKVEKDGKIVGQTTYGYKPQFVLDVTNRTVGPTSWRYDVIEETEKDNQVVTQIQFWLKAGNVWIPKGSQFGVGQIVRTKKSENIIDGRKSAIANACQKCLSLMSIGSDAYRGLLKGVFFGGTLKANFCQNDLTSLSSKKSFFERILAVNQELETFGKDAIQKKEFGNVQYGYKPQYVFDAVNRHIGPANWRWEVIGVDITGSVALQAGAKVRVYFLVDGEWFDKGIQYGVTPIVKGNEGDAFKGAIVNGIQKCFSAYSIGSNAYRGLLEPVFESNAPGQQQPANRGKQTPPKQQPPAKDNPPSDNKANTPRGQNLPATNPPETTNGANAESGASNPGGSNSAEMKNFPDLPKLPGVVIEDTKDYWLAKASGPSKMSQTAITALMDKGFFWQEMGQGDNIKHRLIKRKEAA